MGVALRVSQPVATGRRNWSSTSSHFYRLCARGILKSKVSLDIGTADFKAMLVPEAGSRRAHSDRGSHAAAAGAGVEIRLLHRDAQSAALRELKRRCAKPGDPAMPSAAFQGGGDRQPRMYLGSANLTGRGPGQKGEGKRNFELVCGRIDGAD